MRIPANWPRLVFICVPLLIISVDAVVLVRERLEPPAEKAIRLVRESNSRKENFTVQQYLYTTVYHRLSRGESIDVPGWRTELLDANRFTVEFKYSDPAGLHVATWEADLRENRVTPRNETALDLSWH